MPEYIPARPSPTSYARRSGQTVTLSSGGLRNRATVRYFNDFSRGQCESRFKVWEQPYTRKWFVLTPNGSIEFKDGVSFTL